MKKYLEKVSRTVLDKTNFLRTKEFLPVSAPLLDFLVEDTKRNLMDGNIQRLKSWSCTRGGKV